jgi:hypothetical protein
MSKATKKRSEELVQGLKQLKPPPDASLQKLFDQVKEALEAVEDYELKCSGKSKSFAKKGRK